MMFLYMGGRWKDPSREKSEFQHQQSQRPLQRPASSTFKLRSLTTYAAALERNKPPCPDSPTGALNYTIRIVRSRDHGTSVRCDVRRIDRREDNHSVKAGRRTLRYRRLLLDR